jgi:hypothetical protein
MYYYYYSNAIEWSVQFVAGRILVQGDGGAGGCYVPVSVLFRSGRRPQSPDCDQSRMAKISGECTEVLSQDQVPRARPGSDNALNRSGGGLHFTFTIGTHNAIWLMVQGSKGLSGAASLLGGPPA